MNLKKSVSKRWIALNQAMGYRAVPILPAADWQVFFNLIQPIETQYPLVRIGGRGDGGYLLPDDFTGINTCFSPGVGPTSAFEEDLAGRGIKSFLADYSVDRPATENVMFHFEKKFIGSYSDDKQMTLESWVNKNHVDSSDLILQMDIEGSEYEVISSANLELLTRFRIIVIEFHELGELFCPLGLRIIQPAFTKLLKNFSIVHLHPNNCSRLVKFKEYATPESMEVTFLRKDRISVQRPRFNFPHLLDERDTEFLPDIILPPCWY